MRAFLRTFTLLWLIFIASVKGADVQSRPALMVQGKSSLVNLLDIDSLMKRGQGTGMVFFSTVVGTNGDTRRYYTRVYGGSANTELLTREITGKIDRSIFHPALYHGTPQAAMVCGTVAYAVVEGKPHLRIYLNQEMEDLKKSNDFIAPQLLFLTGTQFQLHHPTLGQTAGIATVRMSVDETGNVTGMKLEYESPKGKDFGGQLMMDLRKDAKFLPGYRNGKPVACSFTFPMIYKGITGSSQWKLD